MNPNMSSACHIADASYQVPRCTDAGFLPAIIHVCEKESVAVLIPTIDTELPIFAGEKDSFKRRGVRLVVSDLFIVNLARDKFLFQSKLIESGIACPRGGKVDFDREALDVLPWPCIFKPRDGSRSIGLVRAESKADVPDACMNECYLWQEWWKGVEYTVNMFVCADGRVACAIPHERVEVRAGEVSKGVTRKIPALEDVAQRLGAVISGAYGPLCFQAIVRDDGEIAIFELNARFGGGYPLAHYAGGHFTQWILEDVLGLPSSVNNFWKPNKLMLRYDESIFTNA